MITNGWVNSDERLAFSSKHPGGQATCKVYTAMFGAHKGPGYFRYRIEYIPTKMPDKVFEMYSSDSFNNEQRAINEAKEVVELIERTWNA